MTHPGPPLEIPVSQLLEPELKDLNLALLAGSGGLSKQLNSPRIQKLGLALAGFANYIHPGRVQFVGGSEINFLQHLSSQDLAVSLSRLRQQEIACIVVTKGLVPPAELLALAEEKQTPLFTTPGVSSVVISRVTAFLEDRLGPRASVHGVLMDIFGLGVLLLGESAIGKSEAALELVIKGHRLVADDLVDIKRLGLGTLVGFGPTSFQHLMEIRGLGILNIKDLFGVSSISLNKPVQLAIQLERWRQDEAYDRLGVEESVWKILDVEVPLVRTPVAPGRNMATIVEVAARVHLMKLKGYHPGKEFMESHQRLLQAENDTR